MDAGEENQEYKENLFHLFGDTGIMNSVKAQMRHKIVEKLVKSQKVQQAQQKSYDEKNQHRALLQRVMASIVAEYFDRMEFTYSNSIFQPESGFSNKILQRFEVLDLLNAKNIENPKISILESMVETYLNNVKNVPKTNCSTQTEHADAIFNLEQRLNTVDHKYREKVQEISTPAHEIEERLQRFKRDFENRLKGEMNAEIVRIREFEMSTVRMEEQERYRKEMSDYREQIEKNYTDRLGKLRDRERDTIEKCTQKMKEIETVNHDHRQRILKDFELLRMREDEIDKQRNLNEETVKLQRTKLENMEQELKEKIKKAEETALIIEKKYQNDLAYTKLEAHRDLETEKLEILEKKRVLDEDMYKIKQVKDTAAQLAEQTRKLTDENRKLTDELLEVKRFKKEQEFELTQLRDNLRSVSDSYKRDQDTSKNVESKLKVKDEEVNFYKTALDEQKRLVDQYKQSQVDNMKKFNNELQVYQSNIEVLEEKIKELRRINKENEELLDEARKQKYEMNYRQPLELFKDYHVNLPNQTGMQGNTYLKPQIQKELDDLKEKRRQEILQYQRETEVIDKKNHTFKFDNIWDISNASIDFSQFRAQHQDKQYVDKTDLSKSQLYQDFGLDRRGFTNAGATNLIEESFREDDFAKYEAKLKDSFEKIDQNNSSRLRVMTEVEKSRRDSFNAGKGKHDENQNFTIKKTTAATTQQSPTRLKEEQQQTKSTFSKQTINQIGSLQDNSSTEQYQIKHKKEDSQSVISKDAMLSIPTTFTKEAEKKAFKESPLDSKKQQQPLMPLDSKKDVKPLSQLPPPLKQRQQSDFNYNDDFDDDLDDFTSKNKKTASPYKEDKKDLWGLPKDSDFGKKDISDPFSKKKQDPFSFKSDKNDDVFGKKFDPLGGKKDDKLGKKDDAFGSKKYEFSLPSTSSKQQKPDNKTAAWGYQKQDKSTIDNKDDDKTISEDIEEVVDYNEDIVDDIEYF